MSFNPQSKCSHALPVDWWFVLGHVLVSSRAVLDDHVLFQAKKVPWPARTRPRPQFQQYSDVEVVPLFETRRPQSTGRMRGVTDPKWCRARARTIQETIILH